MNSERYLREVSESSPYQMDAAVDVWSLQKTEALLAPKSLEGSPSTARGPQPEPVRQAGFGHCSGYGQGFIVDPGGEYFARRGAVMSPREPWPLLTYKPSSHGQGTSGTCRASLRNTP